jgi:hypothetical protein
VEEPRRQLVWPRSRLNIIIAKAEMKMTALEGSGASRHLFRLPYQLALSLSRRPNDIEVGENIEKVSKGKN